MFTTRAPGSAHGTYNNAIGNIVSQSAYGFGQYMVNNVSEIRNTYGLYRRQNSISSRGSNSSFDSSSIASSEVSISHDLSAVTGCDESFSSENGSVRSNSMPNVVYSSQNSILQIQHAVEHTAQNTLEFPVERPITTSNPSRAKPIEDIPVPTSGLKSDLTGKIKSIFCCIMPCLTPRERSR